MPSYAQKDLLQIFFLVLAQTVNHRRSSTGCSFLVSQSILLLSCLLHKVRNTGVPSGDDGLSWLTPQIKTSCMRYLKQRHKGPNQGMQCCMRCLLPRSPSHGIHIWQSQELYSSPALDFYSPSDPCLCMVHKAAWSRPQHVGWVSSLTLVIPCPSECVWQSPDLTCELASGLGLASSTDV